MWNLDLSPNLRFVLATPEKSIGVVQAELKVVGVRSSADDGLAVSTRCIMSVDSMKRGERPEIARRE